MKMSSVKDDQPISSQGIICSTDERTLKEKLQTSIVIFSANSKMHTVDISRKKTIENMGIQNKSF